MESEIYSLGKIYEALVSCDELGYYHNSITDDADKEILERAIKNLKALVREVMDKEDIFEQDLIGYLPQTGTKVRKQKKKPHNAIEIPQVANLTKECNKQVLFQIKYLNNEIEYEKVL